MKTITLLLLTMALASSAHAGKNYTKRDLKSIASRGQHTLSYDQAREHILGGLYLEKMNSRYFVYDVYCQEPVYHSTIGPGQIPSNKLLNVEHIWPQSRFSTKESKRGQKTDLHHLLPVDARANGTRGNHEFGYVEEGKYTYMGCEGSRYDKETQLFEPDDSIKGNIARSMFYFSVRYDLEIGDREERVLREWNQLDPVSEEDREIHEQIFRIQGNRNPFIDDPSLVDEISDF